MFYYSFYLVLGVLCFFVISMFTYFYFCVWMLNMFWILDQQLDPRGRALEDLEARLARR